MFINGFLIVFGSILLGALLFFSWVVWGAFFYGAPLVSTSKKVTREMIKLADVHSKEKVYDLGCGSGTILFSVEKFSPSSVQYIGYDLIRPVIWYAQMKNSFLKKNIKFQYADIFKQDFSEADVIFCYLLPKAMEEVYSKIWPTLKTGCKIISHGFPISSLRPVQTKQVGKERIYLYQK